MDTPLCEYSEGAFEQACASTFPGKAILLGICG